MESEKKTVQAEAPVMEFDDQEATLWKPKVGETLFGTLEEVGEFTSKYGEQPKMVLRIKDASGTLFSFIPPSQPLRVILERMRAGVVAIGKPIGLKFLEEKKIQSGTLKIFAVSPKMPEAALQERANGILERFTHPDHGALEPDAEAPADATS